MTERFLANLAGDPPSTGPIVSVVVVNRDGLHHLRRLFPMLERTEYEPVEFIVVDNGSEDGSVEYLEALDAPWDVQVIRNPTNRSFSEANNQGFELATGDLVLFLNNDVEPVEPGWLGRMVDRISGSAISAVGARLVYPSRPDAVDLSSDDLTLQHRGIHFLPSGGCPRPVNLGTGENPFSPDAELSREVPAATAACLLVDRHVFERIGGFDRGYEYGTEDVDLCLKIRAGGGEVWYEASAFLYHYEFGTQSKLSKEDVRRNRLLNRRTFIDRWGPQLFRTVFEDRLETSRDWSHDPFHIGITVTRDEPDAGYGDYHTAHELGDELVRLGWRVSYIERFRDRWYEPPSDLDVVLVLLDAFDLTRLKDRPVTVAWVRNWTERWLDRPWFADYDIVLASSQRSVELIEERSPHHPRLMPLATNPSRFTPTGPNPDLKCDLLFAGNRWDRPRDVEQVIEALSEEFDVRVHGEGWEGTPLEHYSRGSLPYEELSSAYASAGVVLDDTAEHSKPYGALNSRVFDAIAAGRPVVTDNENGVHDLFDEDFPSYDSPSEASELVRRFLGDPRIVERFVGRYRPMVLNEHTYEIRARTIHDRLRDWVAARRCSVTTSVPGREADSWGDWYFARDLQNALETRGVPTNIHTLDEIASERIARSDFVVHLFGRAEFRSRPSQLTCLWIISHPDDLTDDFCASHDLVFAAGRRLYERLRGSVDRPVIELHQATDPGRFAPRGGSPAHELLFVGNSRGVRRKILDDLLPTARDLAVYGRGWTRALLPRRYLHGEHVPNDELAAFYSAAKIVLNDHWPDMRENGIFSNRIYDALASGAFVMSDDVDGLEEEFDGGVVSYRDPEELAALVDEYLGDEEKRRSVAQRGRAAVLSRHTFLHRVDTILEQVLPMLEQRQRLIV